MHYVLETSGSRTLVVKDQNTKEEAGGCKGARGQIERQREYKSAERESKKKDGERVSGE